MRPGSVTDPRPQERVLRHTLEHIVDFMRSAPMVQILDAPVPQMVEQLPDIKHLFDTLTPDPEQVIEVPKILPDDVPIRTAVCDTQLAEQLVEVPTNPGYVLAVVASKFFSRRALWGILSGQSSTASGSEQIFDIPVSQGRLAGRREGGGLQGSLPAQNSAAVVEQSVDISARGGLQGFRPGQGSTASSTFQLVFLKVWMSLVKGFFSHFSPC